MNTLYKFLTAMCKEKDMRIEELQKKINVSRTTLYRYMKGINRITPEMAPIFIAALDMDAQQTTEFSKYISLSAFDQSLIESRYVLDDFLFENQNKSKTTYDVDMVLYNKDKYLRTLKGIIELISSFSGKEGLEGEIRIVNCMNENIFIILSDYLKKSFSDGLNINVEHFVGLSLKDYLQNTYSFTYIFPLIKYEKYRLYYREKDSDDNLMQDSVLVSLAYRENGNLVNQYFSISFHESGMPECIAFDDMYMYSYLSKIYENLKFNYDDVMKKYDYIDFSDDIFAEMQKYSGCFLLKPNPCYEKMPYEVYNSVMKRMNGEELKVLLSSLFGEKLDDAALPDATAKAMQYIKKRIDMAQTTKQIDVYSKAGLTEFAETGKVTDHLEHLPPFNQHERQMVLKYIFNRSNNSYDNYSLYITENDMPRKELVLEASKGFGLLIGYIYPEPKEGLWKTIFIQNERLTSIFCDYLENHIPVNLAMEKDKANSFLKELIDSLNP